MNLLYSLLLGSAVKLRIPLSMSWVWHRPSLCGNFPVSSPGRLPPGVASAWPTLGGDAAWLPLILHRVAFQMQPDSTTLRPAQSLVSDRALKPSAPTELSVCRKREVWARWDGTSVWLQGFCFMGAHPKTVPLPPQKAHLSFPSGLQQGSAVPLHLEASVTGRWKAPSPMHCAQLGGCSDPDGHEGEGTRAHRGTAHVRGSGSGSESRL